MEKQTIKAIWPIGGTINAKVHKCTAVVIYDADEEMEEQDIRKGAWVEWEDSLVEAFLFNGEENWCLDDIGLGNVTTKSADEPYPTGDKLIGSGWHLQPYQVDHCPGEYFWKPVKDA